MQLNKRNRRRRAPAFAEIIDGLNARDQRS